MGRWGHLPTRAPGRTRTISSTIATTLGPLPASTPAFGWARFTGLYVGVHGDAHGVPQEVHTAPLWAGPESAEDHAALCERLREDASTLEAVATPGAGVFLLLAGAGDACDVWAYARVTA